MTAFLQILPMGSGYTLTHTSTGDSSVTITFNGQGEDTSTAIEIENMASVDSASFSIEGQVQGGAYPTDVMVDVNDDGDTEWEFTGDGYGSLGQQNEYSNDEPEAEYVFTGAGTQATTNIRLPKSATVTSTSMAIVAGPSPGVIWTDDFSTDTGWTGYGGSGEWERLAASSGYTYDPSSDHTPGTNNFIIGNDIAALFSRPGEHDGESIGKKRP